MLSLVDFDEIRQRVGVFGVELDHLLEGIRGTVAKASALEVHPQAEQRVGTLVSGEPGAMENALVNLDSALELPLLSKQVAEDEIDLDRLGILARGDGELGDGTVYLTGGEKVQAENVVDG